MTTDKNRRSFLQGAALAGATAATPVTASAVIKTTANTLQANEFPLPEFESMTGLPVTILSSGGDVYSGIVVEVESVEFECSMHARPAYLRACSKVVRFEVENAQELVSDIYQVRLPKHGKMDLMLTVVPDVKGRFGVEAVFN